MPTLMLGDLPIRLESRVFADLMGELVNFGGPDRKLTRKESAIRIGVKALIQACIASLEDEIRRGKLNLPPPGRCPKGEEYITWGFRYVVGALEALNRDATFDLAYRENADGSLTLEGFGPTPRMVPAAAVVDSLPPAAPAAAHALPAPAGGPAADGANDPGESLGSMVRGGLHGERQDAVCEAAGEAAAAPLSSNEPVYSR